MGWEWLSVGDGGEGVGEADVVGEFSDLKRRGVLAMRDGDGDGC